MATGSHLTKAARQAQLIRPQTTLQNRDTNGYGMLSSCTTA